MVGSATEGKSQVAEEAQILEVLIKMSIYIIVLLVSMTTARIAETYMEMITNMKWYKSDYKIYKCKNLSILNGTATVEIFNLNANQNVLMITT